MSKRHGLDPEAFARMAWELRRAAAAMRARCGEAGQADEPAAGQLEQRATAHERDLALTRQRAWTATTPQRMEGTAQLRRFAGA